MQYPSLNGRWVSDLTYSRPPKCGLIRPHSKHLFVLPQRNQSAAFDAEFFHGLFPSKKFYNNFLKKHENAVP